MVKRYGPFVPNSAATMMLEDGGEYVSYSEHLAILAEATSKKWYFCPECGCKDVNHDAAPMTVCANCCNDWDPRKDYLEATRKNLERIHAGYIDGEINADDARRWRCFEEIAQVVVQGRGIFLEAQVMYGRKDDTPSDYIDAVDATRTPKE